MGKLWGEEINPVYKRLGIYVIFLPTIHAGYIRCLRHSGSVGAVNCRHCELKLSVDIGFHIVQTSDLISTLLMTAVKVAVSLLASHAYAKFGFNRSRQIVPGPEPHLWGQGATWYGDTRYSPQVRVFNISITLHTREFRATKVYRCFQRPLNPFGKFHDGSGVSSCTQLISHHRIQYSDGEFRVLWAPYN